MFSQKRHKRPCDINFDDVVVTGDQNIILNPTGRVGRFLSFIESLYRLFPGIRTHFILGKNWNQRQLEAIKDKITLNLRTKVIIHSLKNYVFNKGDLLQNIIDRIKTEYTLIAPSLTDFTNDMNLERLIRVFRLVKIQFLQVAVIEI